MKIFVVAGEASGDLLGASLGAAPLAAFAKLDALMRTADGEAPSACGVYRYRYCAKNCVQVTCAVLKGIGCAGPSTRPEGDEDGKNYCDHFGVGPRPGCLQRKRHDAAGRAWRRLDDHDGRGRLWPGHASGSLWRLPAYVFVPARLASGSLWTSLFPELLNRHA